MYITYPWLDDRRNGVRFPVRAADFCLVHSALGTAFYPIGTWGSFSESKAAGT